VKVWINANSTYAKTLVVKAGLEQITEGRDIVAAVLNVKKEALEHIDPCRVFVDRDGYLRYCNTVDDDEISLKYYRWTTSDIDIKLLEFIVNSKKKEFDIECMNKLYELQNEAVEATKKKKEQEKEEIRRREEERKKKEEEIARARELLKNEIEELKKRIEDQRNRINSLEKVKEKYEMLKKFIEENDLVNDFIEYVVSSENENKKKEIIEEYKFEV